MRAENTLVHALKPPTEITVSVAHLRESILEILMHQVSKLSSELYTSRASSNDNEVQQPACTCIELP
jgi:hypothetical protein